MLWWVMSALAGDPFVELGGSFGVWAAGEDALVPAFYGAPRLGIWPGARAGVELDLALVSGPSPLTEAGMTAFVPRVSLVVDPTGPSQAPVHARLMAGVGADVERHRDGESQLRTVAFVVSGGVGLDARLMGALRLRVDVSGLGLLGADGPRGGLVAAVGVATRFGVARDADGDRLPDRVDACPDDAEDLDGFQDDDGCRDPDNDQDGVRDELDACDSEPEDIDGVEDDDGCPEG
jgi:hypothetical protein